MEYKRKLLHKKLLLGLNPYYNGRYSWRTTKESVNGVKNGLNPYYNGRYSWRPTSLLSSKVL